MILVARSAKSRHGKTDLLACPRTRRRVTVLMSALMLVCAVAGAAVALTLANPRDRALAQISELHAQVARQKNQLSDLRAGAQRDMDAMAVKLGELQAQSIRLDALGERLAEAGKLDPQEFDFQHAPAVGGPEQNVSPASLPPNLVAGVPLCDATAG